MNKRRVVITGLGILSPIGNAIDTAWKNSLEGKSGACMIDLFDTSEHSVKIGALVRDFDVTEYMPMKEARRVDPFIQYGMAAATQAVKDAGLDDIDPSEGPRIGVAIGSGIGVIGPGGEQGIDILFVGRRSQGGEQ